MNKTKPEKWPRETFCCYIFSFFCLRCKKKKIVILFSFFFLFFFFFFFFFNPKNRLPKACPPILLHHEFYCNHFLFIFLFFIIKKCWLTVTSDHISKLKSLHSLILFLIVKSLWDIPGFNSLLHEKTVHMYFLPFFLQKVFISIRNWALPTKIYVF